jgi:hypothetical protein
MLKNNYKQMLQQYAKNGVVSKVLLQNIDFPKKQNYFSKDLLIKNCYHLYSKTKNESYRTLLVRASKNSSGNIVGALANNFYSLLGKDYKTYSSFLNIKKNFFSTSSGQVIKTPIERELSNLALQLNLNTDTVQDELVLPNPELYAKLSAYSFLLERFTKAQELVNFLRAKHRLSEKDKLTPVIYLELLEALKEADILVTDDRLLPYQFPLSELSLSDKSTYKFNNSAMDLKNERDLFLLNLVNIDFKNSFPKPIISMDQLVALMKINKDLKKFFLDIKTLFNFTLTINPIMFKAGVTPAEFKAFIEDKKRVSLTYSKKQAYQKGLSKMVVQVKETLANLDVEAYSKTSIIYKIDRIDAVMLPIQLRNLINTTYISTREIEEATAKALKVFRKYCLYKYKTKALTAENILSVAERALLINWEMSPEEFDVYISYLENFSLESVAADLVK